MTNLLTLNPTQLGEYIDQTPDDQILRAVIDLLQSGQFAAQTNSVPATGGTFTGAIIGPFEDKGGAVFNVKAYGAVGDGTTNDSAAIQAAVTAAGAAATASTHANVVFPYSTYKIDTTILIPSYVELVGFGATLRVVPISTVVTAHPFGSKPTTVFKNADQTNGNSGIRLRGLTFDGRVSTLPTAQKTLRLASDATEAANVVRFQNCDDLEIVGCKFYDAGGNWYYGPINQLENGAPVITMQGCTNVLFDNNRFTSCYGEVIWFQTSDFGSHQSDNIVIRRLYADNQATAITSLNVWYCSHVTVEDCYITHVTGGGSNFRLLGQYVRVNRCKFVGGTAIRTSNNFWPVVAYTSSDITIENSELLGSVVGGEGFSWVVTRGGGSDPADPLSIASSINRLTIRGCTIQGAIGVLLQPGDVDMSDIRIIDNEINHYDAAVEMIQAPAKFNRVRIRGNHTKNTNATTTDGTIPIYIHPLSTTYVASTDVQIIENTIDGGASTAAGSIAIRLSGLLGCRVHNNSISRIRAGIVVTTLATDVQIARNRVSVIGGGDIIALGLDGDGAGAGQTLVDIDVDDNECVGAANNGASGLQMYQTSTATVAAVAKRIRFRRNRVTGCQAWGITVRVASGSGVARFYDVEITDNYIEGVTFLGVTDAMRCYFVTGLKLERNIIVDPQVKFDVNHCYDVSIRNNEVRFDTLDLYATNNFLVDFADNNGTPSYIEGNIARRANNLALGDFWFVRKTNNCLPSTGSRCDRNESMADDDFYDLDDAAAGGRCHVQLGDDEESAEFTFTSNGIPTIVYGTAHVAFADTDTNLAIFTNSGRVRIKNRLGAAVVARIDARYN